MDCLRFKLIVVLAVLAAAGLGVDARSEPFKAPSYALADKADYAVAGKGDHRWTPDVRSTADARSDRKDARRAEEALLQIALRKRSDDPEWLVRGDGVSPLAVRSHAGPQPMYVALQTDRLDGTDLLTVRQSLKSVGPLQLYAGAGLGRARYVDDDALSKPLPRRRTHHALGAAAELGAHTDVGERMSVEAGLRWMQLGHSVTMLQSDSGPMNAKAVLFGVTVGYRFR
jgi:hypothetical protein